jgi:thymidylate synthase (FAD)
VNNHADAWKPPVKPRVYVISRPRFDVRAVLAFLQQEATKWRRTSLAEESEEIIEIAGRVCYMSFGNNQSPRSNKEYIRNLIRQGHESVLEHVSWTFILTGVSRAFTHQLVRHRVGFSFSQLSQQYHEETSAAFVEPAHLQRSRRALQAWRKAVAVSQESYRVILTSLSELDEDTSGPALSKKEFKRAIRSAARSVLPNATETKIVVTANARALRHFFKIRGSIPGDVEMREVAAELFGRVRKEAPQLFHDFTLQRLPDGTSMLAYSGE